MRYHLISISMRKRSFVGIPLLLVLAALIVLCLLFLRQNPPPDSAALGELCAWNNCPEWSADGNVTNVHLICHTHDDLGWLKTADDYYTGGTNVGIFDVGVQYILSSVTGELAKHPARRFSFAETGFLVRWLEDKSPEEVAQFRRLVVETGQLELIGGGWTQPDEAATHYYDLVDQYSLGLRKLSEAYGKCGVPKIAWQIDPFGHSREHGNLVHQMGYEALFFSRMHYAERMTRIQNKTLEMLWSVDETRNRTLFTGAFARGTYGQPDGLCFDVLCGSSVEPVVDDPSMDGYNLESRLNVFLNAIREQRATQGHNHLMMTMGNDFTYSNANMWFSNLDRLIRAANKKTNETGIRVFYSTPSCYLKGALENVRKEQLPRRDADFFPYASNTDAYWTGYFSSKPAFKGLARKSSALLQLTRLFDSVSWAKVGSPSDPISAEVERKLEKFERAQALVTHHDAITGTAKEAVTQNYAYRLFKGWDEAEDILNGALNLLAPNGPAADGDSGWMEQRMCRRINDSFCAESMLNDEFVVTVWNGNGRSHSGPIRIPVNKAHAKVVDGTGKAIPSQVIANFAPSPNQTVNPHFPAASHTLLFDAEVPPLGFSTFFVSVLDGKRKRQTTQKNINKSNESPTKGQISNQFIRLNFNENGLIESFEDLKRDKKFAFSQQFRYYSALRSGAYLFRPDQNVSLAFDGDVKVDYVKNDFVQEARQTVTPWISQVVRLYADKPFAEFEFVVGPLPKDEAALAQAQQWPESLRQVFAGQLGAMKYGGDENSTQDPAAGSTMAGPREPRGCELITTYSMPTIRSDGAFWTDSNGRQMVERTRDHNKWHSLDLEQENFHASVAANYHPVNSRMWLRDSRHQMTVLTDRSQGGSSLNDGQLELMVHRRHFLDDGLGVGENLDEPGEDDAGRGLIVRGKHWLHFGPVQGATAHRPLALELFNQPTLTFANFTGGWKEYARKYQTKFSALASELPPNVNLLTLKRMADRQLLLRIEHFYQRDEHPQMGEPATVNLMTLFNDFKIHSVRELALAGNYELGSAVLDAQQVRLDPMQIRTFVLSVE